MDRFVVHRAFPHDSAPVSILIKVLEWRTCIAVDPDTELPRVVSVAPDETMPSFCRFADCLPLSVSFIHASALNTFYVFEFPI